MASFTGNVTGGSLYLRSNASTGATSLASIPNGTSLTVTTISGDNEWFSTTYSGKSGFVMARYIAITTGGSAATVTTGSGTLSIRATPSSSGTVSFVISNGSSIRVLDTTPVSGFYRIGCSSGCGWGSASLITLGSGSGGGTNPTGVTMYVYKIPTNETVNLRIAPDSNANVLQRVGYGKAVTNASPYINDYNWHNATYNGSTGYIMSIYLTTDPNLGDGGSGGDNTNYNIQAMVETDRYSRG